MKQAAIFICFLLAYSSNLKSICFSETSVNLQLNLITLSSHRCEKLQILPKLKLNEIHSIISVHETNNVQHSTFLQFVQTENNNTGCYVPVTSCSHAYRLSRKCLYRWKQSAYPWQPTAVTQEGRDLEA